jgi:uncharacterized protein YbgA (DUF1722 family)
MFKDSQSYDAGIKRIIFLQGLYRDERISYEEALELSELMVAAQQYEDALEAEARAEQDYMDRFEDAFLASQER